MNNSKKEVFNISNGNAYMYSFVNCLDFQGLLFDYGELLDINQFSKFYIGGIGTAGAIDDYLLFGKDTTQNNTCRWLITNRADDYTNTQLNWLCSNNGNSSGDIKENTFLWGNDGEFKGLNDTYTVISYDFGLLPASNISNIGQFDQVFFIKWSARPIIDFIANDNLLASSNTLPDVNVSISNFSYCLVNDTLNIPLNLSAGDKEGDTIYYATTNSVYTNITNKVDFTKQSCIIEACIEIPDHSVFKNLDSGECDINRKTAYNSSQHNLIARSDYYGNQRYMLELNSDCNRADKSFNYVLGSSTGLYFSSYVWDLDNTEELNLSYYRSDSYELLKLQLLGNGTQADLYYNGSIISSVANMNFHYLNIRIEPQADRYRVFMSNGTQGYYYDLVRDPFIDNVQYIKLSPKGKITIEQFSYQATVNIPDFTTTEPTHITVSKAIGRDYFTLFVTDDVHLNSDFITETIPFDIETGSECTASSVGIGQGDVVGNIDILGVFKSFFGSSLKSYLISLGYYDEGDNILWIIFFFMFLGLVVSGFLMFGSMSFTIPLFLSSICCGIIAFMVDYTGSLIAFLILLALSLAPSLSKLFTGDR